MSALRAYLDIKRSGEIYYRWRNFKSHARKKEIKKKKRRKRNVCQSCAIRSKKCVHAGWSQKVDIHLGHLSGDNNVDRANVKADLGHGHSRIAVVVYSISLG